MYKIATLLLLLVWSVPDLAGQSTQGGLLIATASNSTLAVPGSSEGNLTSLSVPIPISSGGTGAVTATNATADLQYLQGAIGSLARAVSSKLRDTVSVLDFAGCDPTGVADSTICIKNAIASFNGAVTGGVVYMPAGIYKISATLDFGDKQNIYLHGAGFNTTVIRPTALVKTAVSFGNIGTNNQGISDLTIDCSRAVSCDGVRIQKVNTFTLSNVSIHKPHIGINIQGGVIQYYTNFVISNPIMAGIYLHGGNDQYLVNGVIQGGATEPSMGGIWSDSSGAFWIMNVDAIACGNGMLLNPGTGQEIDWLFVMNSAFDSGNGSGIFINPTGTGFIKGSTFIGNWTSTNRKAGVFINGTGKVQGLRFIGHRSFNNVMSGYMVGSNASFNDISFDDSDASGNSTAAINTYSGFDIGAISGLSISNCRSGQEAGFRNTQSRGILINPGHVNNYILVNNDVRGNLSASILDDGTGTTKIVKNNLGYNPIAKTAIVVAPSPYSYTNSSGDTIEVFVAGGMVNSITVAGSLVASATNVGVIVPQGEKVVVTYGVAPKMSYAGF